MARKIPAKLVLELLGKGISAREIQRTRHVAPQSVAKVRDAAEERRVGWEDVAKMDEAQVYELLFPREAEADKAFLAPDYAYVHTELQKTGVTMQLLHEELKDEAAARGLLCKSYTTFCRGYADYVAAKNVTNHLEHKPGQVMEVDWSGAGMRLVDPFTGEATKVHLFVACLPYSQMTYVEGTLDMRQNTWLSCHVNAWAFYGGVAVRTVCDNLKTGVVKHPREGEVVLNEAYEALGRHYMTAITPTQVRKPKQKASVEGSVGKIATAVVARLRNEEFSTLDELNKAVRRELDAFNARPIRGQRMVLRALRQPQLPHLLREEQLLGAVRPRRQEGRREGHRLHGRNLPRRRPRRHPPALPLVRQLPLLDRPEPYAARVRQSRMGRDADHAMGGGHRTRHP